MSNCNVVVGLAALILVPLGASVAAEKSGHHWSYAGATGPTHWAALEPEFGACGSGHAQSPIDIRLNDVRKRDLPAISFHYQPAPLKIVDNGHSIQVNYTPGSFIDVGEHRYELVQFHFHKPSEERVDGKKYDMVAHLVHKDAQGRLGVLAVPLTTGAINLTVAVLWNNMPPRKGSEVDAQGVEIDASDLLPSDHSYYTFAGSLTTPPCSEGVDWFVLKHPSTLSAGEIARFAHKYPMNARPVQPLNGRVVHASQ